MAQKSDTIPPTNIPINSLPANMPSASGGIQQVVSPNPYPPQYPAVAYPAVVATVAETHTSRMALVTEPDDSTSDHERDRVYKLTPHVELEYDEMFKESESAKGFPFMKAVNTAIYKYTLLGVYASFALILAPLLAFLWAIIFAFLQIAVVWMIQPSMKAFFVMFRVSSMLVEASVRLFMDPIFRSCSLIFSGIKGRFQISDSNLNVVVKTGQIQNV